LDLTETVAGYPLLGALRGRRSRRFGRGMRIEHGPLAYRSAPSPSPLTEAEEAVLAFAACGVTGHALADLAYGEGQGGSMLAGLAGRTVASADAVNTAALAVINDDGAFLLRRPQDFPPEALPELIALAEAGDFMELYRRSRVRLTEGRVAPPLDPPYNLPINRWSLYAPGTTYFLPVAELTALYLNVLLELFEPATGAFLIDERAGFRPAGLDRFRQRRGGSLKGEPGDGNTGTIHLLETSLVESAAVETGMVLQNLGLMTQALGLCGFPNFARHEYGWFQALGFRMQEMPGTRFLGAPPLVRWLAGLLGKDAAVPFPVGLEHAELALRPYCPPHYPTMTAAVQAFVAAKWGAAGPYQAGARGGAWRDPDDVAAGIDGPSDAAVAATTAYCEYVFRRYGRFPAYSPPFRTTIGYQACRGDLEFYNRFYRPEALTETQRRRD
jgi:hypothetical protein